MLKDKDPPKPLYFPIVLTAEDGTQLYGSCLTFYERMSPQEIHKLYQAFHSSEGTHTRQRRQLLKKAVSSSR